MNNFFNPREVGCWMTGGEPKRSHKRKPEGTKESRQKSMRMDAFMRRMHRSK